MRRFYRFVFVMFVLAMCHPLKGETAQKQVPEVLSLGAAIVDHFFMISDEQLRTITLTAEKGTWAPIDYETLCTILKRNPDAFQIVPGGTAVNVMKGLSHFKHPCRVVGKIGSDDKGEFYLRMMRKLGIDAQLEEGKLPTGQSICFITPDAERTFLTYLGSSHSLTDMKLEDHLFEGVRLFHLEGFQLVDPDLTITALKKAKRAGMTISMDLANIEIVRRNKDFLLKILPKYVDIVFCNEQEAKELFGLPAKEACSALANFCEVAVVTMSERGCWTQSGNSLFYTPAFNVKAIDSTGAGDLFASGFLHGFLCEEPLQKCSWLGSLVSSYVVKVVGAEIPQALWKEIHDRIDSEDPFRTILHRKTPQAHQRSNLTKPQAA